MNHTVKKFFPFVLVGVISGATTFGAIHYTQSQKENADFNYFQPKNQSSHFAGINTTAVGNDFVKAAKIAVPAVVTIKRYSDATPRQRMQDQDIFDWFFNDRMRGNNPNMQMQKPKNAPDGMGSGVIVSPDGYIITNNHVIQGATKLEVVLSNKKVYIAKKIGTDPNTDVALLKIEEKGLPYLNFGNSDNVEIGQWAIAVGNPMGLNSTVTAGIISAKARNINLLGQNAAAKNPVESFIQTDAAINPGNSGGALVDTEGNLIGINAAISSNTGYYEGYGFAIPSNLARKIVEDIKKYGIVQRGYLGISLVDLSQEEQVDKYNQEFKTQYKSGKGILISSIADNSGAKDAGLKVGDIITKVDDTPINNQAVLMGVIGEKRQGDKVLITYIRKGVTETTMVTLKDQNGSTSFRSKADLTMGEKLGADFSAIDQKVKVYYGIENGVIAKNVTADGLLASINVSENNIIFEINNKPVNSEADIEKILKGYKGTVSVKYLDDNGRITSRGFTMP
ncbi:MAG: trypsin-like peptidase domain-containing protein [Bacteroidetes bacterium]|nr:trypsin-like peptidase domain-containing protein [Bacteroidota bacterium]